MYKMRWVYTVLDEHTFMFTVKYRTNNHEISIAIKVFYRITVQLSVFDDEKRFLILPWEVLHNHTVRYLSMPQMRRRKNNEGVCQCVADTMLTTLI